MSTQAQHMPPSVAGQFYPDDPGQLAAMVDAHLDAAPALDLKPKAMIAPHAGYVYSGAVAGTAYRVLRARAPKRVVLLGPSHRTPFKGIAVPDVAAFRTPVGDIPVDRDAIARLLRVRGVGVLTDAFRPEHSLDVHLPFLRRALGEGWTLVPMMVGDADPLLVDEALDAVWGDESTAIVVSSDLSHYHDYDTARGIDTTTSAAIETLRADVITPQHACGHLSVNGLLQRARRLNMRATAVDVRNSGDTAGPKDRVVGYGSYLFEYAGQARLSEADRGMLRDAAIQSIRCGLRTGKPAQVNLPTFAAPLRAVRASFVTLTLDGKLRGCIGSTQPHRPLIADVVENGFKAAFSDPRFPKLTDEEARRMQVKVSVLGTLRSIPASSEKEILDVLQPERDGLLISDGAKHSAIFLPDVWAGLNDPRDFLRALKQKAGLQPRFWPESMKAYRYTTEVF